VVLVGETWTLATPFHDPLTPLTLQPPETTFVQFHDRVALSGGTIAPGVALNDEQETGGLHKLSGGALALHAPHAPLPLQVSVPEFVIPQEFDPDVQGCVVPAAQTPPPPEEAVTAAAVTARTALAPFSTITSGWKVPSEYVTLAESVKAARLLSFLVGAPHAVVAALTLVPA
jgi:hypothetical protein